MRRGHEIAAVNGRRIEEVPLVPIRKALTEVGGQDAEVTAVDDAVEIGIAQKRVLQFDLAAGQARDNWVAQQAVTGNLSTTPVNYGSNVPGTGALATQSINTGFGNSNYTGTPNGPDANGSELDAAYGVVQNGNLDLFFSGNFENNGNHVNVFIDDGAVSAPNTPSGQNTLNISNGWTAAAMNGSVFSPGFNADLLLDANDYQGNLYVDQYNLNTSGSTNSYLGAVALSAGIGKGSLGGIGFGLNNSNVSTMGGQRRCDDPVGGPVGWYGP